MLKITKEEVERMLTFKDIFTGIKDVCEDWLAMHKLLKEFYGDEKNYKKYLKKYTHTKINDDRGTKARQLVGEDK